MSEQAANTVKLVALTRKGAPTDPDTKQEAFRLWIELGRSWKAVSDYTGIPDRTLRNWGDVDRWEERRLEQAHSFLPGAKAETSFALRLAAHNASLIMQRMVFDSAENGTPLDEKQMKALAIVIDRGGYSPVGSRNPIDGDQHLGSDQDNTPNFSTMSIDQLRQYELSKRKRRHSE